MERDLVTIFSTAVASVAPHLKETKMLTPVTMSLFGMVNWHYLWFKSAGSLSREEYAEIVTRLISDGARSLLKPSPKTSKRTAAAE
jgi:TetR/AcrR family transcriptional regulator